MRQRVMIAMALACQPDIILADEPTTALDVTIQAQILFLLADLKQERKMSMIFITHNLGIVARIADRVAIMYGGEIVEIAPVDDLFAQPQASLYRDAPALRSSFGPDHRKTLIHSRPGSLHRPYASRLPLRVPLLLADGPL